MPEDLPLSVWATAQVPGGMQRRGRYLPESNAHPGRMLPDVARHIIRAYSRPGELVLDPLCGIGTTLVEAVHLGRQAIGVDYEPMWSSIAAANVQLAATQGATGTARVLTGDSRTLEDVLGSGLHGKVALIMTSPPYGPSTHGKVRTDRRELRPVETSHDRYSDDRLNLAHMSTRELVQGVAAVLSGCKPYLRPDGILAMTVRPWRRDGVLIDLPRALADAAGRVGLVALERNVALLTGLRADTLVPRASFFQMKQVRRARRAGSPLRIIAHEDVLVFRTP